MSFSSRHPRQPSPVSHATQKSRSNTSELRVIEPQPRADDTAQDGHPRFRRIALVGNPNVGKSVIFGALTGTYATVSNYPGTTVEVAQAASRLDPTVDIIDTPGVNSLTPNSEDERVTRDILLAGVDTVVQVADAKNLTRALVISFQLADAGVPFVLVLNMMDEAADRGVSIDAERLSRALGVPVVQTVAVSGHGLSGLSQALRSASVSQYRVRFPVAVELALLRIEGLLAGLPMGQRSLALMCLAGDDSLRPWLAKHLPETGLQRLEDTYRVVQQKLGTHVSYELSRCRMRAADELARSVMTTSTPDEPELANGDGVWILVGLAALAGAMVLLAGDLGIASDFRRLGVRLAAWAVIAAAGFVANDSAEMRRSIGQWASHRYAGLGVLFFVLYVVYRFVGVLAAGTGVDFLEHAVFGKYINPAVIGVIDHLLARVAPAAGVGAHAAYLARQALVGPYGMITVALTYALAIILPIVTAFFIAFSVLEDSGYLPRLAVIVNRVFNGMGLNGKAVLPMVLGLGCDTMATLTARIMESRKERLLVTLLLALGVPCSAQLGVILGLLGALPMWAPMVWGAVVLGTLFAVGFLAARLLPGERSDMILEMPPIRRPQLSNILLKTVGRLEWYLKEAVPIFVLGTLVLFLLDASGLLDRIVRLSEPVVVGMLNLPPKAAEAFLVGFFRRDYGSAGIYAMFEHGVLSPVQAVVALVTITLFVPCVANFFVIVKEQGLRIAMAMTAFIFPFAFLVGGAVNLALRALGLP